MCDGWTKVGGKSKWREAEMLEASSSWQPDGCGDGAACWLPVCQRRTGSKRPPRGRSDCVSVCDLKWRGENCVKLNMPVLACEKRSLEHALYIHSLASFLLFVFHGILPELSFRTSVQRKRRPDALGLYASLLVAVVRAPPRFDACQDCDLNPCIKWVLEKYWNICSERLCFSVQQTVQSWRGSFVWLGNGGFGGLFQLYIDCIFWVVECRLWFYHM